MSGAGWQGRGARALLASAQYVKAMGQRMELSQWASPDDLEALQQHSGALRSAFEPHLHDGIRLESGLRAAMVALSRELIAANTVLRGILAISEGSARAEPVRRFDVHQTSPAVAATFLEFLAATLLRILGHAQEQADDTGNFTYLVLSSGAVILESAALACSTKDVSPFVLENHTQYVQRLILALGALGPGQENIRRALRATICTPDATMTCLRRLFPESQGTPRRDCGRCATAQVIISLASGFELEHAAINADAALQQRIVCRAAAALRGLRTATGGEGSLASSPPFEAYKDAASAIYLLSALPGGTHAAARGISNFAEEVIAGAELLLRLNPPPEVGLNSTRHQQVLNCGVWALHRISMCTAEGGVEDHDFKSTLAFNDMVRCLALALAMVARIRQAGGEDLSLLVSAANGLHSMLVVLFGIYNLEHPDGRFPSGEASWAAQHQALDGMLRLMALLPPCLPEDPADVEIEEDGPHVSIRDPLADLIFGKLRVVFKALWEATPRQGLDTQEAVSSLAGFAGSATKLALRLAGPESSEEQLECLNAMVEEVAGHLRLMDEKEDDFSLRRWQGAALAVWGAAASVSARGYSRGILAISVYPLISAFMEQPWACNLALATPARRSTVLQLYECMLSYEGGGDGPSEDSAHWFWDSIQAAAGSNEAALGLARCGVLSRLLRWAAENCLLPQQQVPGRVVTMPMKLACTLQLVRSAASGRASQEVRDAVQVDMGGDHLHSPAFWERLRAESVEPLMLELEAAAAEEEGDAARQAQLAVGVAEALATRPCAHPCCTTILGAHEADAPRGKLCSGCRVVRYCGAACQKADWPAHKTACREVARRRSGASSA